MMSILSEAWGMTEKEVEELITSTDKFHLIEFSNADHYGSVYWMVSTSGKNIRYIDKLTKETGNLPSSEFMKLLVSKYGQKSGILETFCSSIFHKAYKIDRFFYKTRVRLYKKIIG
jgi:hypothetical protein